MARNESGAAGGRERGFRVLVIDDAESVRTYLANLLELRGYEVDTAEDGRRAMALLEGGADPDLVLLDMMMPGWDGLETLRRVREFDENLPVVVLSVVGKATTIVEAMRLGAADYLNKPFEEDALEASLAQVLAEQPAGEEFGSDDERVHRGAVWESAALRRIRELLEQVADTDVTVLIHGESGVGKEIVSRSLHELSPRAAKPFVKVNCAALPEELLESELFGYEKGAFTGAHQRKPGKFELAHRGTIFLDEIGEMSPGLQAKLLQVLQDSCFARLGGNREIQVDARVVCATNRKLDDMVREGTFREDLFFRLNVVSVALPPLRERREEIVPLAQAFARRFAAHYRRPVPHFGERLLRSFQRYPFPGNVRELENMVKRIIVLENEESIVEEMRRYERVAPVGSRLRQLIEEIEATAGEIPLREVGRRAAFEAEREAIDRVLHHTNWNRKQAARILGVSYKTLLQKIRGCGLEPG